MRAFFWTQLVVRDNGGTFVVAEPLVYQSVVLGGLLVVQPGFPTDFASVPRGLWNILPPIGRYDAAAVCHDKLYRDGAFEGRAIDRGTADRVLLEAMEVYEVNRLQRWLIYAGVRAGGWAAWRRYRSPPNRPSRLSAS